MLYFENDYSEGAHPKILQRLIDTNMEQLPGYGTDPYCSRAAEKIGNLCRCPEAEVYFLSGGTQTNQIVINTMLRQYEGVIAASTGHINIHEAGAVEFTGHKVLEVSQHDGKIDIPSLKYCLDTFYGDPRPEHMIFPGMGYISHPAWLATVYQMDELTEMCRFCREARTH